MMLLKEQVDNDWLEIKCNSLIMPGCNMYYVSYKVGRKSHNGKVMYGGFNATGCFYPW